MKAFFNHEKLFFHLLGSFLSKDVLNTVQQLGGALSAKIRQKLLETGNVSGYVVSRLIFVLSDGVWIVLAI